MAPIITLLTDFGIEDGYVASMKGVILGICPGASLVDVSHMVPAQDIRAGAYIIATTYRYFPAGTVHLAVVDPGVGTKRRALALEAGSHYFVGPDNGLFSIVMRECVDWSARSLENPTYWRSQVSNTFHGRDLFAPVAAHLAAGLTFETLGPPCTPIMPVWGAVERRIGSLRGEVLHIDHFGNTISNVRRSDLEDFATVEELQVVIGSHIISRFAPTYDDVELGELLFLFGSSGYLEVAVNRGNAARALGVQTGDSITLQFNANR